MPNKDQYRETWRQFLEDTTAGQPNCIVKKERKSNMTYDNIAHEYDISESPAIAKDKQTLLLIFFASWKEPTHLTVHFSEKVWGISIVEATSTVL